MILPFHATEERLTKEVLEANMKLLEAISNRDWKVYEELCHKDLTCFEPEAKSHLVKGLKFHEFFFTDKPEISVSHMVSPTVKFPSEDRTACLVAYTRVVQTTVDGKYKLLSFQESRLWQLIHGKWIHVHFHKSQCKL
jgi:calcium/calmodulin-dependent protein kinase (CaM kinase) II